ncbi:MAG: thioesterase family protein [Lachnospiraceae bacterium]|nr:thioesterase family protein [Lachnospiraceae bacterium]
MLETGIKGTRTVTVNEENTAKAMGSGTLEVFATPALIALMEETCWRSVANELEEGSGTVGTLLEIKHTAPTPVGMKVTCESTLTEVDGRRLVFEVIARDAKGVVGEGMHERFVIQNEKFQVKANAKLI